MPPIHPLLEELPLVAILRGLRPDEAEPVGDALVEAGFRILEVPLNSPEPMASIERLAKRFPHCLVGAGTVLHASDVARVAAAGGELVVAPNFDAGVVAAARRAGLLAIPGVATPTEAFAALAAGARCLKLFPAESIGPAVVRAWRAVLPADVPLLPVGGITPERMREYLEAGASGFGLGSALYREGETPEAVAERAQRFVSTWQALHGRLIT